MNMLCQYCGAKIPEGTSTCTLCGAPLKEHTHKKTLFVGIVLCFMVIVLTATFILSNTYLKISEEPHSVQENTEISVLQEGTEISLPANERIGDAIPLWDIEDAKIYQVSSEQTLDETDITDLIYKLQTRAGYYSEKAKILAENDCGTWYVKISIPDVEDEDVYDFICSNASLEFIVGYGTESAEIIVDSSHILSATSSAYNDALGYTSYTVDIFFTEEGSKLFANGTTKHMGDIISIVYDGQIISAPTITSPITKGQAVINGLDSFEEAQEITTFLNIGKLNVDLEKIE